MKRIFQYILMVSAALLLWGCPNSKDKIEQRINDFCKETELGIYNGETMIYEFVAEDDQIAFSATDGLCRLQKDDQSKYVQYTINDNMELNAKVKVAVVSKGLPDAIKATEMTVKKIEGDKVWLWQADKQYGHLIYWEQ